MALIKHSGIADFNDQDLQNVQKISLKEIASDDSTSVKIDLGSDSGDDFIVDTDKLVVEGDTGNVGVGTATPTSKLHVNGAAVVEGNLTVNGTTTTISTTNTVVEDKLIELANGTSGTPSGDAGLIIERGSSDNAGIIWDESRDEFVLGTTSATGASSGDLTVTRGNVSVAKLGAGTEQAATEVHAVRDVSTGSKSTTAPIIAEDDARPAIQLSGSANNIGLIQFGDDAAAASGQVYYDHSTDKLRIDAGGNSDRLTVDANGDVAVFRNLDVDGTLEADAITVDGTALATVIAGTTVTTATNATNSSHVLVTDNESTDEENLIAFVEGATSTTGNVGLEMDGNLTYNPSSGTITATVFKGDIDAVDGDFDGTLEADAITVGGVALATVIAGTTVTTATNATNSSHVLVTDNESTNEENLITFVEGATSTTGNVGLEMDGHLTYNPSTGTVTATIFKGNIDAVDIDVDGTLEADNITIGGAQGSDGQVLTSTGSGVAWEDAAGGGGDLTIVTTSSATYSLTTYNTMVIVDSSSNAVEVDLPTASGNAGKTVDVLAKSGSTNAVTIDPNGSETINGSAASRVINVNYSNITLVSDGTNWVIR